MSLSLAASPSTTHPSNTGDSWATLATNVASRLAQTPDLAARVEATRQEVARQLVAAGFTLLYTGALKTEEPSTWYQLSARLLVQEHESGHVLSVSVVLVVDRRPARVGATTMWLSADPHEPDAKSGKVAPLVQLTLAMTAGLAVLGNEDEAFATLADRFLETALRPVNEFVQVLVQDALAP